MLFLLIPAAWLAVVLIGLAMCRLGAVSDRRQATALAEWITAARIAKPEDDGADSIAQLPYDSHEGFRATG